MALNKNIKRILFVVFCLIVGSAAATTYGRYERRQDYVQAEMMVTSVAKELATNWNSDILIQNIHPNVFKNTPEDQFKGQVNAARTLGSYKKIELTDSFVKNGRNQSIPSTSSRPAGTFEYLAEFGDQKARIKFDVFKDEKLGWKIVYFCVLPPE